MQRILLEKQAKFFLTSHPFSEPYQYFFTSFGKQMGAARTQDSLEVWEFLQQPKRSFVL